MENCDGKPYSLSDNYAYIMKKFEHNTSHTEIQKIKTEMLREYIRYEIKNNPESVIDKVINSYEFEIDFDSNYRFIYRPAYMVSSLAQYAIVVLRFKRSPNDGLKESE